MDKLPITAILSVKNEAENLPKCLAALKPAERVVVLDSHSSDTTAEIARDAGIEVLQFEYKGGYPKKRQWALENLDIRSSWILLLDADEVVPEALWKEIGSELSKKNVPDAFLITKGFHFMGRRFRFGGFSFAAVLLIQKGKARFERLMEDDPDGLDMEVHERVIVDGTVGRLVTPIIHEDFKGLDAYLGRHRRYAMWEAKLRYSFFSSGRYGQEAIKARLWGNTQERRRFLKLLAIRMPFEPLLWFGYHYFLKLGFLEGHAGWIASKVRYKYIAWVREELNRLQTQRTSEFCAS